MDSTGIALIIAIVLWPLSVALLFYLHHNEKKDLRDRLMARDFGEYKYFKEELPEFQRERREEFKEKKKQEKKLTKEQRELKEIAERM